MSELLINCVLCEKHLSEPIFYLCLYCTIRTVWCEMCYTKRIHSANHLITVIRSMKDYSDYDINENVDTKSRYPLLLSYRPIKIYD